MHAYLFPGQAAMLRVVAPDTLESNHAIRQMFEDAEKVFGIDFTKVDIVDERHLRSTNTAIAQPLVFLASMAEFMSMNSVEAAMAEAMAGHSLGEITALAASGALTIRAALELIQARSAIMQEACEEQEGAMLAVLGLAQQSVQSVCDKWNVQNERGCDLVISNFNSPNQFVISGSKNALNFARVELASAERIVTLAAPGAFHSQCMSGANEKFAQSVLSCDIQAPTCPVYQNVTGRGTKNPTEIRKRLLEHMVSPVQWTATIQRMAQDGVKQFSVIGRTGGLPKLVEQIDQSLNVSVLDSLSQLSQSAEQTSNDGTLTPNEKVLIELWKKTLSLSGKQNLSKRTRLFECGADSLDALQLSAAARVEGLYLSVENILQFPVLSDMAKRLEIRMETYEIPTAFSLFSEKLDLDWAKLQAARLGHLTPENIEDILPCSPLQAGLMAITAKRPGSYVTKKSHILHHEVNLEKLKSAWSTVLQQTPILRTKIVDLPNVGLVQVVCKSFSMANTLDLSTPMGLGSWLFRLDFDSHSVEKPGKLTITIHHAVFDAWSLRQVQEAVDSIYYEKPSASLVPFVYFIGHLNRLNPDAARSHWSKYLKGLEAPQFPRLPSPEYQSCANHSFLHQVKDLTWNRNHATASVIIRAAYGLLISRITSSSDVVFGATVIGRQLDLPGSENIAGPMIATIPVRVRVDLAAKASEYLNMVQQQAAESIPHEQLGLSAISKINEDTRTACGFQSLLVVQNGQQSRKEPATGTELVNEPVSSDALGNFSAYACTVECTILQQGFSLRIEYDHNVVTEEMAENLGYQLEHIIHQLNEPAQVQSRLAEIPWTCEPDLSKIVSWNRSQFTPVQACVHNLFTERANSHPSSLAICAWDGKLTYKELDMLSNKLAYRLILEGCDTNQRVGTSSLPLYFEKSVWTVVSILAVMKAGGSSCLMDVNLPEPRLNLIASQLSPTLALSSRSRIREARKVWGEKVIIVDENALEGLLETPPDFTFPIVSHSDPVCTLFTSGSTGKPKGIVLQHSQLCSAIEYQRDGLNVSSFTRLYDFPAYAFDLSWFTWNVLCAGGCICIPSEEDRRNDFAGSFSRLEANTTFVTPSVIRTMTPKDLPGLSTLILGGEPVNQADIKQWGYLKSFVNTYGPAECTMTSTMIKLDPQSTIRDGVLGKGIGASIWLVDILGSQLAPVGGLGEIWIEGPNVSIGYLSNEEQSMKAFVEDPKWLPKQIRQRLGRKTQRFYRTGDLATQDLVTGQLSFMGRRDFQVKINGQRVELGEIQLQAQEALPMEQRHHIQIETIVPKDHDKHILVAFIAFSEMDGERSKSNQVLEHMAGLIVRRLRRSFAEYMMPKGFIPIPKLPMTATGKVDRRRLQDIGSLFTMHQMVEMNPLRQGRAAKPTTPSERLLATLWADLLQLDVSVISRNDSFYELGGDSIAAMRLAPLAREQGLLLTALWVMQHPVLSDQANLLNDTRDVDREIMDRSPCDPFSLLDLERIDLHSTVEQCAEACAVATSQITDIYPCTPLQESLIAATVKDPRKFVGQLVYEIGDPVDGRVLLQAFSEACQHIDILRARIVATSTSGTVQVTTNEMCSITEWQTLKDYHDYHKPSFGLGTPLLRVDMIHVSSYPRSRRLLVLTAHHAIYDRWSLSILLRYIECMYRGLPPPGVTQFNQFVRHTTNYLDQEIERKFWVQSMQNVEPVIFPKVPISSYTPLDQQTFSHRIITMSTPHNTNILLSSILTTSWGLVMSRYLESDKVVFGMVNSGRGTPMPGIENVLGPTITTVPVLVHVSKDENLLNVLKKVQERSVASIPFEQTGIANISSYSHDLELMGRFQTLLVIQPSERDMDENSSDFLSPASKEDDIIRDIAHAADDFGAHALSIQIFLETHGGCRLKITHDPSVLNDQSARRLARQFEAVLNQVNSSLANHDAHKLLMSQISLNNDQDMRQIWEWNAAEPVMIHGCVHDLVSKATARYPDEPAVCSWEGQFTHKQLDNLSARLAYNLVQRGIGPGSIIPLCFAKSIWTVVAIMGVMRAGAASVTMDINQPVQRLRQIVENVTPTLILCSKNETNIAKKLCTEALTCTVLPVSEELVDTFSSIPPASILQLPRVEPSSPLYVVFTSGSTGVPKGAVISHENFCSVIHHQRQAMRYGPMSRVFDFVSYAFDVTWPNILQTLTAGGCVCVPSEDERKNDISGAIKRLGATAIHVPPSVARLVDPADVPNIDLVVLGGEPVTLSDVTRWGPGVEVVQVYGPAECTPPVMVSYNVSSEESMKNIGRGYGVVPWIVEIEDCQKLAPIGVVGELLVEGPLIGLGYLGNPEKTKESFLRDPMWLTRGFHGQPGRNGRLYRTGDLARYETDGSVIFVGRKDTQVKIRGQRIELGEVESHIAALFFKTARKTDVLVEIILPKDHTDTMLVVFIVAKDKTSPIFRDAVETLSQQLPVLLPAYMVPSAYIPVEFIPVTGTGKKDRRRLRDLGAQLTLQELFSFHPDAKEKRQPTTEWESKLHKIASELLRIDGSEVGVDDSFLQLGGNSITAMKLVAMIRKTFQVQLSVSDVFEHPQISQLATILDERAADRSQLSEEKLGSEIVGSRRPFSLLNGDDPHDVKTRAAQALGVDESLIQDIYPCTALQEGLLASTSLITGAYVFMKTFRLEASLNIARFRRAWENVASQTPILRTRFIEVPGTGLLQVVLQQDSSLQMLESWTDITEPYDGGSKESSSSPSASLLSTNSPSTSSSEFGLGLALSQCWLVRDVDGDYYFTWRIHHALYDGISFKLIVDNLLRVYNEEPLLPTTPFQQFVAYLEYSKNNLAIQSPSSFWEHQLGGSTAVPFPSLPSPSYRPRSDSLHLHPISGMSWARSDLTPPNMIRAAWALLSARYTAASSAVFGAVVSGRQAPVPGIDSLIGPTIATVPLVVQIEEEDDVSTFLHRVQEQTIKMIPFEQTGLQTIRRFSPDLERKSQFNTLLLIQSSAEDEDASLNCPLWSLCAPDEVTDSQDATASSPTALGTFNSYALLVQCDIRATGDVTIKFEYDSVVMDYTSVQYLAEQFERGLRQLCSENMKTMKVKDISFLTDRDLDLYWSTNVSVPATIRACIHEMIRDVCIAQPQKLAIDAHDGKLTYQELERITTVVARELVRKGVQPKSIVPILTEKSLWAVVAALAAMKAGAVAVLIDAFLPKSRLNAIIQLIQPDLIMVSTQAAELSEEIVSGDTIRVCAAELALFPDNVAIIDHVVELPQVKPSDAAYIIFTSGSTGTPKGVVITHSNFCSSIFYQSAALRFNEAFRIYDFASYSYDVCWANILQTLAAGACLCIPSESERRDDLEGSIVRFAADMVELTPSVSRTLSPNLLAASGLKTLNLGGEAVTGDDVLMWAGKVPTLLNTYGPSEATPTTTVATLSINDRDRPHIGTGVGTCCWVVDGNGRLAPIGTIGELWLEGPLVGACYLGDAVETAARFIKNPSWLTAGHSIRSVPGRSGIAYKTGDLVKLTTDGNFEYIGRTDSQVKINGQRTELADIERQIQKHKPQEPAVAIVADMISPLTSTDSSDHAKVLVAFLALQSKDPLDLANSRNILSNIAHQLESSLLDTLPRYMVPSMFFVVDTIPLGPTGKANRPLLRQRFESMTTSQLAESNLLRMRDDREPQKPLSSTQEILQELWGDLLKLDSQSIRLEDNFFRLGGDSIMAMRLVALARLRNMSLTVADVFRQPQLLALSNCAHLEADGKMAKALGGNTQQGSALVPEPFSLLRSIDESYSFREEAAFVLGVNLDQVEDMYPCTPLQEGLIAITESQPGRYIAQFAFELPQNVNISRFKEAWATIADHFPILRTRFAAIGNLGVLQVVLKNAIEFVQHESWQQYNTETQELTSFGLNREVSRFELIVAEKKPPVFIWTVHHSLYDGQSFQKYLEGVTSVYEGTGLPAVTPFSAFIKHLSDIEVQAAANFWLNELKSSHATPFPRLPSTTYKSRPTSESRHTISGIQLQKSEFAVSTYLQAAWSILVSRHSNSSDVIYGLLKSGLNEGLPGVAHVAGPTLATVPVRMQVDESETAIELLRRVQEHAADMLPFEQTGLQSIRQLGSGLESKSNFNTLMNIQFGQADGYLEKLKLFSSPIHPADLSVNTGLSSVSAPTLDPFDLNALSVKFFVTGNSVEMRILFDDLVIETILVDRMLLQFEKLLRQICSPDLQSWDVFKLSTTSTRDLDDIWAWNPPPPPSIEKCIHDIIFENVRTQGLQNDMAVEAHDGRLTYAELDIMSDQLAATLIQTGPVEPNVIVPIFFEKSRWTIIVIVAIWKAGGAALTLDSNLPDERLAIMVEKVSPRIVITSPENSTRCRRILTTTNCQSLIVDEAFFSGISSERTSADASIVLSQSRKAKPSDLLYIVFTSGSTGVPKGVILEHRHLASANSYIAEALGYHQGSRAYDFAAFSFDVSWSNMIFTLTKGGCLCIPTDDQRRNDLAGSFRAFNADLIDITPSVSRTIDPKSMTGLKSLVFGGEAVLGTDIARWKKDQPDVDILHTYGPAETTPKVTSFKQDEIDITSTRTRFGYGLGVNLWLVEPQGSGLSAIGCVGELWIEGPLVSAGYFENPEKSAVAFIENPEWLAAGSSKHAGRSGRLYRTGDLCKYNMDGTMSYISRIDTQVKVGGHQVQLVEIEHLSQELLGEAGLTAALDFIIPSGGEAKLLVAFVASSKGVAMSKDKADETVRSIRGKLIQQIPSDLAPRFFIQLDSMPVTNSGKVDRRRLKDIGQNMTMDQLVSSSIGDIQNGEKREPQTKEEMLLRSIWSQVLSLEEGAIGLDDTFIQLGGDSITAMKVVSLIRKHNWNLTTAEVLNVPVLESQAKHLGALKVPINVKDSAQLNGVGVQPQPTRRAVTHFQNLCIDAATRESSPSWYGFSIIDFPPQYTVQNASDLGGWLWTTFEILRAVFSMDIDGYSLSYLDGSSPAPISSCEFDEDLDIATEKLLRNEGRKALQLDHPFLRFWIFGPAEGGPRLIIRLCHAQYDGISLNHMLSQLASYAHSGRSDSTVSFDRYLQAVEKSRLDDGVEYWTRLLDGGNITQLPGLHPHPDAAPSAPTAVPSIRRRLAALPTSRNFTPATLFTALSARVLSRIVGSPRLIFGRLVSGRAIGPEFATAAGPCINFVPIRVDDAEASDVVSVVQSQLTAGLDHEAISLKDIQQSCPSLVSPHSGFGFTVQYQNFEVIELESNKFEKHGFQFGWRHGQQSAEALFPDCIDIRAEETVDTDGRKVCDIIVSGPQWREDLIERVANDIIQFDAGTFVS